MKDHHALPQAPGGLPLIGHLIPMLRDPLRFLARLPAAGDLVEIRLGSVRAVVVCTPELTWQVLTDDRTFDKGGPTWDRSRELTGDGLASCPHNRHRRQRRLVQPAFHPSRLPGYAQAMSRQAADCLDRWHEGQIIDIRTEMWKITSGAAATTLLSGALPQPTLRQVNEDLTTALAGIYWRILLPPLDRLPTAANRRYHRTAARLRDTIHDIVTARRAAAADHDDVLSALLATQDPTGDSDGRHCLADDEIVDQILAIFLGGAESTASTLSWALYLLSRHPAAEHAVHSEVDEVLAGRPAHYNDLPRLQVTRRIITETLRLYPPFWLLSRLVTTDTRLGGYHLPAGTAVFFSPYLLHRRPDTFADPDCFEPGRWDSSHIQPSRQAFLPFGAGARKCIGDQFGIMQATLVLATIATQWTLLPLQAGCPADAKTTLRPRSLKATVTTRRTSQPSRPGEIR
jgi:cytochrome P450